MADRHDAINRYRTQKDVRVPRCVVAGLRCCSRSPRFGSSTDLHDRQSMGDLRVANPNLASSSRLHCSSTVERVELSTDQLFDIWSVFAVVRRSKDTQACESVYERPAQVHQLVGVVVFAPSG